MDRKQLRGSALTIDPPSRLFEDPLNMLLFHIFQREPSGRIMAQRGPAL